MPLLTPGIMCADNSPQHMPEQRCKPSCTPHMPQLVKSQLEVAKRLYSQAPAQRIQQHWLACLCYHDCTCCFHRTLVYPSCSSSCFGPLGAILTSALHALLHACTVVVAPHHLVLHTNQVLGAACPDHHHAVLLKVMTLTCDNTLAEYSG